MLRQNFVKNSTLQKEKEKKKQRVENDENNVWKKAQGCCHFNCKKFQKKVSHTKYQSTKNIAKIFQLQGIHREDKEIGKEGNTATVGTSRNKFCFKLRCQRGVSTSLIELGNIN